MQDFIDRKVKQINALKSPVTQQVVLAEINKMLSKFGQTITELVEDPTLSSYAPTISIGISLNTEDYDTMMADVGTSVEDTTTLCCYKSKTIVLATYGIDLYVCMYMRCPLPKDDLTTLRILGKVKWHSLPPSSYESVSCDIF